MRRLLARNLQYVQALTAILTAIAAVAALIGIKVQIDANNRQQQEQSAREIYREFLNLSISRPEFADPDYCAIAGGPNAGAYENYVEYMLYTADQLLSVSPDWEATIAEHAASHRDFLCTQQDWSDDSAQIRSFMREFQINQCRDYQPRCS
jgi:hypothetical protein